MKKYLLLIACLSTAILSFSQGTYPGIPAFGTSANSDRTYRPLQLGLTTITDSLGTTPDTLTIYPGELAGNTIFEKYYIVNLKDSCVIAIRNCGKSYTGSKMHFLISNGAVSGWIQFLGYSGLASQWAMTSGTTKISPTASHWKTLDFICTGNKWAMTSSSQD